MGWTSAFSILLACVTTFGGHKILDARLASFTTEQRKQYETPLYDLVHAWTPDLREYRRIPDYGLWVMMATALFVWPIYVDELLITTSLLYTLRAALFCFTLMPRVRVEHESKQGTQKEKNVDKRADSNARADGDDTVPVSPPRCDDWRTLWETAVDYLLRIERTGRHGHSHDSNISGHAVMLASIVWHWVTYQILSPSGEICLWTVAFVLTAMVVVCRCHLSQDVIIAWCISIPTQHMLRPSVHQFLYGGVVPSSSFSSVVVVPCTARGG